MYFLLSFFIAIFENVNIYNWFFYLSANKEFTSSSVSSIPSTLSISFQYSGIIVRYFFLRPERNYRKRFLLQFEQPELLPEMPFDIGTVSHSDKFPRFQWGEVLRFIYLFLLCADGHAGITAVTAAAGTGGLLLLLVFPEKERVIFQCLHILCAAQKDPHATFVKEWSV